MAFFSQYFPAPVTLATSQSAPTKTDPKRKIFLKQSSLDSSKSLQRALWFSPAKKKADFFNLKPIGSSMTLIPPENPEAKLPSEVLKDKSHIFYKIQNFSEAHQEGASVLVDKLIEKFRELTSKEQSLKQEYENLAEQVLLFPFVDCLSRLGIRN